MNWSEEMQQLWSKFYYTYIGWGAGVTHASEAEIILFRILKRMRDTHHVPAQYDEQYILCMAWHEIKNETCVQERW